MSADRYARGCIAVDLDGTLAEHYWPQDGPYEPTRIGKPVPAMVARVKAWLASGQSVVIFTARVGPHGSSPSHPADTEGVEMVREAIVAWTVEHIGVALEVTCVKTYRITELWDDRAVRVRVDEGVPCCSHHAESAA